MEAAKELAEQPVPQRWWPAISAVVHRMVMADFIGLVDDGVIATPELGEEIAREIDRHPCRIVDLPADAWRYADHIATADHPGRFVLNMWDEYDGYSYLIMTGIVHDDGTTIAVEIESVEDTN